LQGSGCVGLIDTGYAKSYQSLIIQDKRFWNVRYDGNDEG